VLQLPTVALIERWRARKAICWWAAFVARVTWLGVLVVPWAVPAGARPIALFALLLTAAALGTVSGAAWNPWIRDFLPQHLRNRAFARRMATATTIGAVLRLLAGLAVEELGSRLGSAFGGYAVVLGAGAAAALRSRRPQCRPGEGRWAAAPRTRRDRYQVNARDKGGTG
jgi:hypothetical protein